jgi:protocatechuate 3,4-dioxygenase beta subunit
MSSGTPLRLGLSISQNNLGICTPLRAAIVDVWHCDASGIYSGVTDLNGYFRSEGKKFLRGYQVTDGNGMVHFLTIYPGWYSGRTVHIHVKIRATLSPRRQYEFTSQLYFDEVVTDAVHMQPAYAKRGRRTTLNHMDGIFRRAGNQLILRVTRDEGAYTGIFHIGLKM